ncbi:MAG: DNA/RNA non-specific endonuclease [Methylococcaceae bacterium]|nr:DNA/RNA non-specific endonuclease [Methylococcaceae bacterium]
MTFKSRKYFFSFISSIYKLCKKDPLISAVILILAASAYTYEVKVARPDFAYKGLPQTQNWQQPFHWFRTLRNDAFMLGYSDLRGNPLWVSYKINSVNPKAKRLSRPQRFSKDWRTVNPVNHQDYLHSGYDRGHMAPNYAISRLYGKQAQLDTFLMSNISPQKPKLNQKLWQRLERVEINYFTQLGKDLWVYTGPIFDSKIQRLKNAWNVEIPDAFYKIYALPATTGKPKLLAFLIPQQVKGNEPLTRFLTTVDEIERLTGLDFFTDLPDKLENKLESKINSAQWKLNKVANLPSQY